MQKKVFMSKKINYILFVVALLLFSCGDGKHTVPYTKVNFKVSVNTCNLIHVGGYEYFTGGVGGVFVYRLDMSTFYAYDRACPYDWQENGYVIYDPALLQLVCQECGSTFNVLDGSPMNDSKSNNFLRPYNAKLIDDMTLQVYN